MMPYFWNNVVFLLKAMSPLGHMLRLVDSEKKPYMGHIYKIIDMAKEERKSAFSGRKDKYKKFFNMIDKIWDMQNHCMWLATT